MKYTDNIRFNQKLNSILIVVLFVYFRGLGLGFEDSALRSISFTVIYSFASAFIQPDLDQGTQRPGKDSFPFGNFKYNKLGKIIFPLFYPINRAWYYLWHPYGHLLTHRGISHWPLIGTWTRAGYLLLICLGLQNLGNFQGLESVRDYLKLFFPTKANLLAWPQISIFWVTYALPFFLADIIHFLVDFYDSVRNNTPFESYAHAPGLLKRALNPSFLKYHKKALKKAKANSKKRK